MSKWIIEDWTGKHCYTDREFDSFDEARDFISEIANQVADEKFPDDIDGFEHEEEYNGICEDLYAIEIYADGTKMGTEDRY